MNYIKTYESFPRKENILNMCWHNAKVGDTLPESDIYQYVEQLHRNYEDFIDGDIGERIEKNSKYTLQYIDIKDIGIDEYDLDDDYVNEYIKKYEESNNYPPIVLDERYYNMYNIIDGTHRANAINDIGHKTIKAWVGE